jgi:hypothetical protein
VSASLVHHHFTVYHCTFFLLSCSGQHWTNISLHCFTTYKRCTLILAHGETQLTRPTLFGLFPQTAQLVNAKRILSWRSHPGDFWPAAPAGCFRNNLEIDRKVSRRRGAPICSSLNLRSSNNIRCSLWHYRHGCFWSSLINIVMCMCDYRRGMDWWMDLLTTYTHDSELQAITAPPLISTIHKSLQHPLSIFQPAVYTPAVPWQRLLTWRFFSFKHSGCLHSLQCRTA